MHPSRWPLVRHFHWLYLAVPFEWWYQRKGKRLPNFPIAYVEKYLDEVWRGVPHA